MLLVEDQRGRYLLMVRGPQEHMQPQTFALEVAGLATDAAQAVLAELAELRTRHNVYRGHRLHVGCNDFGSLTIEFAELPVTERAEVVLPEEVLRRVERHAVGVAEHREELLALGQHLKRGLLLYGPPGTGKTHTRRYLLHRMAGTTSLLLSGRALGTIGAVAELARELQPAIIVLEDVDLVAEDRGFGPGSSPVLFELLDAMDGAAPDADLMFLLTTNRADLLEPALAARPGRVDVAVEIPLPDADARLRLLRLYSRDVPLTLDAGEVDEVVARTDGVTASFVKELLRRAVLEALHAGAAGDLRVTGEHVRAALDDLLDSTQRMTRALLGVGGDDDAASDGGDGSEAPFAGRGIAPFVGRAAGGHGGMPAAYRGTVIYGP